MKVQERYKLFAICVILNIVTFMIRNTLSVAILDMTTPEKHPTNSSKSCSHGNSSFQVNHQYKIGNKFNWTEEEQELLLSSFYYAYTAMVFPSGFLADLIGARFIIFTSLFSTSCLALLYPIAANYSFSAILTVRIFQGLLQAGTFTPQTSLWGKWAPEQERTILLGITSKIAILGNLIGYQLTALIATEIGWDWSFYCYGIVGILISFTWLAYCRNSPSEMPWITPEELDFISENNRQVQKLEIRQYPIKSILTSLPFLSVIYSGIAGGFIDFTVISMLPKYIKQALGSDLLKTGIESSLPYLFQLIFVIGSCIGLDYIQPKLTISKTALRKIAYALAAVPTIICLCLVPACGCDSIWVTVLICISMGMKGFQSAATIPLLVDLAPNMAGFLHGIADMSYSAMGFTNPLIAGAIISSDPYLISTWSPLWYISSALGASGLIIFSIFAKSERQSWSLLYTELE